ncbi:MAG: hypothetical protein PHZ07_00295 [Patescibacteria group bacterium]|nr:hypothetical protein [Patescibacteria group bacterium]MDD4695197.1 hypothetical protein [Patescibacteria group bacterium]
MPDQKNILPMCPKCGRALFTANFNNKLSGKFRTQIGNGSRTTSVENLTQKILKNNGLVLKSIPRCQYCNKPLTSIKCAVSGEEFKIRTTKKC